MAIGVFLRQLESSGRSFDLKRREISFVGLLDLLLSGRSTDQVSESGGERGVFQKSNVLYNFTKFGFRFFRQSYCAHSDKLIRFAFAFVIELVSCSLSTVHHGE